MSTYRKSQMIRAVSLLYLGSISRSHAEHGNEKDADFTSPYFNAALPEHW